MVFRDNGRWMTKPIIDRIAQFAQQSFSHCVLSSRSISQFQSQYTSLCRIHYLDVIFFSSFRISFRSFDDDFPRRLFSDRLRWFISRAQSVSIPPSGFFSSLFLAFVLFASFCIFFFPCFAFLLGIRILIIATKVLHSMSSTAND